jgi:rubrerythrin
MSTLRNLEKALAGESMAHIKYRYFAKFEVL